MLRESAQASSPHCLSASGLVLILRERVSFEEPGDPVVPQNFSGADFRDGGYYIRFATDKLSRKDPARQGHYPTRGSDSEVVSDCKHFIKS